MDENGEVVLARAYAPYGETQMEITQLPNPPISQSPNPSITPYGFTGAWTDATGLVYLRARYYAPYFRQFIQADTGLPDPQIPATWNKYTYVWNNPVNFADPSGKCVACVEQDHRNLTYWLISAMKANAQSPEVMRLLQLNTIGNLSVGLTITEWFRRQVEGEIGVPGDCDLFSLLWDSETGLPRDIFKRQAYSDWVALVRKGARWDFKNRIRQELGESIRLCGYTECTWFYFDVVANIHFGYVGRAAGFTGLELHVGAGWAQSQDTPGTGKWYALGDEPGDYWAVEMGIFLYRMVAPAALNADFFKFVLDWFGHRLKVGGCPTTPYYNYKFGVDEELGPKFPVDYFDGGR